MEIKNNNGWISVDDALPGLDSRYLIVLCEEDGMKFVSLGYLKKWQERYIWQLDSCGHHPQVGDDVTVTHWLDIPLPEVGDES
jgi:hypothetical protein